MPKAINLNYKEAGEIEKLPKNTVLISINEEDVGLYPLALDRGSLDILTVRFSDVTSKLEHKGFTYQTISDYNCVQILNFIKQNKDKDFLVHCAAGVSRSTAICLYLHIVYGHELRPNFWVIAHPNRFVLGALFANQYKKYE
jgi:predicted protein tyrosine phosphatase